MLPGPGVSWEPVSENIARVTIRRAAGMKQSVEITVGEDGRPTEVLFPRWSNANPEKVYCVQPFGGHLSQFREFQGFRVPTHVEAGNLFGTRDYFPFMIVDITSFDFPRFNSENDGRAGLTS
jgi:hypothetical protein